MKKMMQTVGALLLALILTVGAAATAFADIQPFAYTGDTVQLIKSDGSAFGMMTPLTGTTAVIDGENVAIHYIPKKTTYNGLHWGAIDDAALTRDVTANNDGSFDISLPLSNCGTALPVAALKSDGTTTSAQYYLAIPAANKLSAAPEPDVADYTAVDAAITKVPADLTAYTPESAKAVSDAVSAVVRNLAKAEQSGVDAMAQAIESAVAALVSATPDGSAALSISNTTAMFKAVSASIRTEGGQSVLVVALSGSNYRYLIPGTYDEAVASGDKRDNWIPAQVNTAGKYKFVIPLEAGQTYVPAVAVSNSYLAKYEAGENPLSRAFYARQFVIDYAAQTLTVGDYEAEQALSVINQVSMFKVSAAALHTVGGPVSNNYKTDLVLTMGSTAYDRAYVGFGADVTAETETAALGEGNVFTLRVRSVKTPGDPDSVVSLLETPFVVSFHSVKKDAWYDRLFTVSESGGTLTVTPVGTYTDTAAGEETVWNADSQTPFTVTVTRDNDDANTFAHFTGVMMDGKVVDPANYEARSGSVVITFKPSYLRTLAAGSHTVTVLFDDGRVHTDLIVQSAVTAPRTGDAGAALWVLAAAVSLAGAAVLLPRRRAGGR